jgi:hypothetical protein
LSSIGEGVHVVLLASISGIRATKKSRDC